MLSKCQLKKIIHLSKIFLSVYSTVKLKKEKKMLIQILSTYLGSEWIAEWDPVDWD